MVSCPKCGEKNPDDAKFCVKCGAAIYPERSWEKRGDTCFGGREEEECFGIRHGGAIVGLIFGFFIVILGLALLLGKDISAYIGPFVLIVIGTLIAVGAIAGLSRTRRS